MAALAILSEIPPKALPIQVDCASFNVNEGYEINIVLVGNTAKGAGGAVSDTTSGVADTTKGATGAKQDAQNPLGLS